MNGSANNHVNGVVPDEEKVAILDAGAQYGKVGQIFLYLKTKKTNYSLIPPLP